MLSGRWCGVWEVSRGTYYDFVVFDQRDFEVEDLYVDSFDVGGFQVFIAKFIGGIYNEGVFQGFD